MRSFRKRTIGLGLVLAIISILTLTGSGLAIGPLVDLSKNQQNFRVLGGEANAYTGEVTSTADFNADGIQDLLMGAAGYNHNGKLFSGAAYVVFGRSNLSGTLDLNGQSANLTIYGAAENSALGHSVAAGDINGDGYQDIIVSADAYNSGRGAVYVIRGGPGRFATNTVIDLSAPTPVETPALTLVGAQSGNRFGRSVATGDVNGDGFDDIIVGAYKVWPFDRVEAGVVYVFYGGASLPASINANSANVKIYGAVGATTSLALQRALQPEGNLLFADEAEAALAGIGDRLGRSVATGDVNADGKDDLILGAYGADVGANADAGKVYIIHGASSLPAEIDLLSAQVALTLTGIDAGDQAGFYVGSGKLNGDARADILIGAYLARGVNNNAAETGEVYVVYGATFPTQPVSLSGANVIVYGAAAGDRLGRSLSAGNVVGVGYEDLILGASRADADGRQDAGIAYVIPGGALTSPILLSQASSSAVRVLGAAGSTELCTDDDEGNAASDCADEAGRSVAAGDLNGDGTRDLIVGALFVNNGGLQDAGAVYVIFGAPLPKIYLPLVLNQR